MQHANTLLALTIATLTALSTHAATPVWNGNTLDWRDEPNQACTDRAAYLTSESQKVGRKGSCLINGVLHEDLIVWYSRGFVGGSTCLFLNTIPGNPCGDQDPNRTQDVWSNVATDIYHYPVCEPKVDNPMAPLTGVKHQPVDLGLRLAGQPLTIQYTSTSQLPRSDGLPPYTGATALLGLHLGPLWQTNLNRTLSRTSSAGLQGSAEVFDGQKTKSYLVSDPGNLAALVALFPTYGKSSFTSLWSGAVYQHIDTQAGTIERYNSDGRITSITWLDGRKWIYHYLDANAPNPRAVPLGYPDLIGDHFDRTLALSYIPGSNRIATLTDSSGHITRFTYDTTGNLTTITWPDGALKTFLYSHSEPKLSWALTGAIDELSKRTAHFDYFVTGQVRLSAGPNVAVGTVLNYSTLPRRHISMELEPVNNYAVLRHHRWIPPGGLSVTSRAGAVSQWQADLSDGAPYLTAQSQPAGAGCAATSQSAVYDTHGNPTQNDDFNATRNCFAYDTFDQRTVQVEGLPQTAICTNLIAANATLPTGSRKISTQWHPDWPVETKRAEPNRITTWVYNGQTDPFTGTVATCAPADALLPDGKPIVVLCKEVQQATTDVSGAKGFSAILQTTTAQRQTLSTYNQHGQLLTTQDSAGNITTHAYYADTTAEHTTGDRQSTTNARAQATQFTTYNKAGQLLRSIDPNGVTTTHTYDPRQRLTGTQVGTQLTTYTYDAAGQLKKITLPDASWIGFEFDAAHRQTAVFDNQGNRIDYTLDNSGRRVDTKTKDPAGQLARQSQKVLDALSRVQQTTGQ
jgi:YD repeat-containing protein